MQSSDNSSLTSGARASGTPRRQQRPGRAGGPAPPEPEYDALIVGARVAGASTALRLARAGLRVLVLDRAEAGADTLSTHALMRGAVVQLRKYGVLDTLVARGTPAIRRSTLHFPDDELALDLEPRDGIDALYAPRRTVLDPVLVEAAIQSGADVRLGCRVKGVTRSSTGVVTGVRFTDPDGDEHEVRAPVTVGADGTRSPVARAVEAPTTWQGSHAGAILYGHFPDPGVDGYHWFYALGAAAGIIPTNDGSVCAWVGTGTDRFMSELRGEPDRAFSVLMTEAMPEWASLFPPSTVGERLFGFGGQPSYLRQPVGPGWALVGDAAYFKDPITAHGITDALRDAELLADAIVAASTGDPDAYQTYAAQRDELSLDFVSVTDRIASYDWDADEIKTLVREEGRLLAAEAGLLAQQPS